MKYVYEIYPINSYKERRCAIAASYKKAYEYVMANTNNQIAAIKINDEWNSELERARTYQSNIVIFGKEGCGGCYFNGFRIVKTEII